MATVEDLDLVVAVDFDLAVVAAVSSESALVVVGLGGGFVALGADGSLVDFLIGIGYRKSR